jgi:hypothetical protein
MQSFPSRSKFKIPCDDEISSLTQRTKNREASSSKYVKNSLINMDNKVNGKQQRNLEEGAVRFEENGYSYDNIDLTIDRHERRHKRKKTVSQLGRDPVFFKDLHVTSNYDKFFQKCIDHKLSLNVKGPLANLHFGFKAFDEAIDEQSSTRKVFVLLY